MLQWKRTVSARISLVQKKIRSEVLSFLFACRSGTLAAIIAGLANGITTDDELVRLIVTMRESRDGLVETPAQYHFIRLALGMHSLHNDATPCGVWCKLTCFLDITGALARYVYEAWL